MKDLVKMSLKVANSKKSKEKMIFSDWQVTTSKLELQKCFLHGWHGRNWGQGRYWKDTIIHANDEKYLQGRDLKNHIKLIFIYRSAKYNHFGDNLKCFHNPDRVLLVHNHLPLDCLGSGCSSFPTTTNIAYLHHHRATCPLSLKNVCKEQFKNITVRDTTIWRWRTDVRSRVRFVLSFLELEEVWENKDGLHRLEYDKHSK